MGTLDPAVPQDLASMQRLELHISQTLQKYLQVAQVAPELLQALKEPLPARMQMMGPPSPAGAPQAGPHKPGASPRPPVGNPGGTTTANGESTNANPESGQ
jgi:hypothetical protein